MLELLLQLFFVVVGVQKSDLLSHKRKLLYEGRIKWMSAHGKAFGLCNAVHQLITVLFTVKQ